MIGDISLNPAAGDEECFDRSTERSGGQRLPRGGGGGLSCSEVIGVSVFDGEGVKVELHALELVEDRNVVDAESVERRVLRTLRPKDVLRDAHLPINV